MFVFKSPSTENGLRVGQVGVIVDGSGFGGTFAAADKNDLFTMNLPLIAGRIPESTEALIRERKGALIPKGTIVRMKATDSELCLVDCLEGPTGGREFWLATRFVIPQR